MKSDELQLLKVALAWHGRKGRPLMDALGAEFGMHHKRIQFLLEKWGDKGWWECGVSERTGWLTDKGLAEAQKAVVVSGGVT